MSDKDGRTGRKKDKAAAKDKKDKKGKGKAAPRAA